MTPFQLAQVNIGPPLAPLDTPQLAEFIAGLVPINALADGSAGFVWRLQTEDGDATAIRPFADERLIINMSVWDSIEALGDFVYRSAHTAYLRRRRAWFVRLAESVTVLWWVPAGHIPTIAEAEERLEHLQRHGPTPYAFNFREPFPPPDAAGALAANPADLCPA